MFDLATLGVHKLGRLHHVQSKRPVEISRLEWPIKQRDKLRKHSERLRRLCVWLAFRTYALSVGRTNCEHNLASTPNLGGRPP